jgi:hypothetical protein
MVGPLTYNWSVFGATSFSGQGSSSIGVTVDMYDDTQYIVLVSVTVTDLGTGYSGTSDTGTFIYQSVP